MKTKIILFAVLMLSLTTFSRAEALSVDVNANTQVDASRSSVSASASSTNATNSGNATSTLRTAVKGNATSSSAQAKSKANGHLTAENHGSAVVAIVKSLLSIADRDGRIGAEVRVVAQSQNDSASTTMKSMTKLEKRGFFTKFLVGSDYKNVGAVRSEMVRTENDINRLEKVYDRTTSAEVRADLRSQIDALKAEEVKLEAFVKANESSFSLLGWLVNRK